MYEKKNNENMYLKSYWPTEIAKFRLSYFYVISQNATKYTT